jgi:protocatechuate 3,4-dioxygenase beta subunit
MRLRIWSMVVATWAIVLVGAWWLHRTSEPTSITAPARGSRASELAEMIRRLPTPKQLALRPVFVATGELRLEGQTVDADKHPIGGATVTLNSSRTTVSEVDGSFAFDHLAAADYTLIAEAGIWYGEDTLTLSDTSDPLELELVAGPTVMLHVVSAAQAPVRDAEVHLGSRHAITDADGNAMLRGLDINGERLSIEAVGYGPIRMTIDTGDDRRATLARTIVLQPGSELAGVVVDEANHPVAGASVQITQGSWRDRADCDDRGRFSFPYVGPGKVALSASSDAFVAMPDLLVDHDGVRANRTVTLHVELGARATGIVVDEHGAPVAKASVMLGSSSGDSDATGHFTIQGIAPGELELTATAPLAASQKRKLLVTKGEKLDLRIVVLEGSIAGTVRDPQGAPVEDAMLNAKGENDIGGGITRTDEHGAFDFGGLPPGRYEISVQRDGDRASFPPGLMVRTTKRDLALVLPELGGITGHVVLAGVPVTYFGVGATIEKDPASGADSDPVREADGTFTLSHLAPGTYAVVVVGPTFERKIVTGIVVRGGEVTNAGAIEVTRGRVVTGHVRDANGQPIANVGVAAATSTIFLDDTTLSAQRRGGRNARTAADGSFELTGLANEDLWIEATLDREVVRQKLAPADTELELVLAATGAVAGKVINARRDHWMMLILSSVEDTMNYYSSDLDLDDAFHFDHVPPGDYVLETSGIMTKAPIRIHVEAGATTAATLELPVEPIALAITSPACERITLRTPTAELLASVDCTAGVARFDDIADGDYLACTSHDACGEVTVRASPAVQAVTLQIQTQPSPPPSQDPEPSDPPAAEDEPVTSEAP